MNFVPGLAAATAYEVGEARQDGTRRTDVEESRLEVTPEMYDHVLKQMEKEAEMDIKEDAKRLKKEAKKIDHLQEKLEKKERHLMDMQEIFDEEEELETDMEEEKLRKAEKKLQKLREGNEDSPCKEKIEDAFDEVKERTKNVLGNVAEYAHLMFANEKEQIRSERVLEKDKVEGKAEPDKAEKKTQKKMEEAAERVEHLRRKLSDRRKVMMEGDEQVLKKKMEKIRQLEEELKDEEKKYAAIVSELGEDLKYEARIRDEERKLRELRISGALA